MLAIGQGLEHAAPIDEETEPTDKGGGAFFEHLAGPAGGGVGGEQPEVLVAPVHDQQQHLRAIGPPAMGDQASVGRRQGHAAAWRRGIDAQHQFPSIWNRSLH